MPRKLGCECGACKLCDKRLNARAKRAALKVNRHLVPKPEPERIMVKLTLTSLDIFRMNGSAL